MAAGRLDLPRGRLVCAGDRAAVWLESFCPRLRGHRLGLCPDAAAASAPGAGAAFPGLLAFCSRRLDRDPARSSRAAVACARVAGDRARHPALVAMAAHCADVYAADHDAAVCGGDRRGVARVAPHDAFARALDAGSRRAGGGAAGVWIFYESMVAGGLWSAFARGQHLASHGETAGGNTPAEVCVVRHRGAGAAGLPRRGWKTYPVPTAGLAAKKGRSACQRVRGNPLAAQFCLVFSSAAAGSALQCSHRGCVHPVPRSDLEAESGADAAFRRLCRGRASGGLAPQVFLRHRVHRRPFRRAPAPARATTRATSSARPTTFPGPRASRADPLRPRQRMAWREPTLPATATALRC